MHAKKWYLVTINLLGGAAVLGSYVHGFLTHTGEAGILWGGVPGNLRPLYSVNMILAAMGYFAFTAFILFRLPPSKTRVGGRFGFGIFNMLYTGILIPSALWMPLTFLTVQQSSPGLLWLVRIVLAIVGLASIGLFLALWKVEPHTPIWAQRLALIGIFFFCIQTALLDAVVWSLYFQL